MKSRFLFGALAALMLASGAQATLIGDTVDAGIFNSVGSRVLGFGLDAPFVVAAGAGDAKQYSNVFVVDFEGFGFTVDYLPTGGSRSWSEGVEFRTLDLDPGFAIAGLLIDTNIVGWADSLASFTSDSATFEWGGLSIPGDAYFNVSFLQDIVAVPEPSSLALVALALLGVGAGVRRRP